MSPASRSKSKDKKAVKEPPKGSKPSGHVNTSSGTPASGYNPILGTFQTFETTSVPDLHLNGRFGNIDETDDQNGSSSTGIDNRSWSGESEDHKDKTSQPVPRQESVPGADNDKREKIRQKNERKHQRQRERRAQELHDRCSGYLMSRKLEALAQQLVAMGFPQEQATMALILNEGRVEESVAWLFEVGVDDKQMEHNLDGGGNLKIDISEELSRINDLEIKYKASKQEVERAVVSCEGDLDKAEETLKAQKEEPPAVPSKPEETGDPPTTANSKQPILIGQNPLRVQVKSTSSTNLQQKRDEKDFNYVKTPATVVGSSIDPGIKTMQESKKIPPENDWSKMQQIGVPAEKRWENTGPNPSTSFSLMSSYMPSPTPPQTEPRRVVNELKNMQLGLMKEPVVVMQRLQSIKEKRAPPSTSLSSSPPGMAMGWYPDSVEPLKPNGFVPPGSASNARSLSPNVVNSNPLYNQFLYQSQQQFLSVSSSRGAPPALAVPSSLGLFSGIGSYGSSGSSSSLVDWNAGNSMLQCDYASIDWSVDHGPLSSRPNELWAGPGSNYSVQNNASKYDSFGYGMMGVNSDMRPGVLSNGNGAGLQNGVGSAETTGGDLREWASPFEERDIFSLPRQFVSSPTL